MKSYFLETISDVIAARTALSERLSGQTDPWLLMNENGSDVIAYLNVCEAREGESGGPFLIQADVSGRHYYEDQKVIALLRSLQTSLGGVILDDDDNQH